MAKASNNEVHVCKSNLNVHLLAFLGSRLFHSLHPVNGAGLGKMCFKSLKNRWTFSDYVLIQQKMDIETETHMDIKRKVKKGIR